MQLSLRSCSSALQTESARLLPALLSAAEPSVRWLSSLPEQCSSSSISVGATVRLEAETRSTVLVSLAQRTWGAATLLPSDILSSVPGLKGPLPARLAVARSPFTPAGEGYPALNQMVAAVAPGVVAVSSTAGLPERRVVVDEYVDAGDGSFRLEAMAVDLLRYLAQQRMRVCYVPDVQAAVSGSYNSVRGALKGVAQSTNEVAMVAPTAFGFNEQAAQDNYFMHTEPGSTPGGRDVRHQVLREYAGLYHQLTEVAGVKVSLFEHGSEHGTPDAVFPNNWFSTHPAGEAAGGVASGTLVLYPMKCPNRAAERRDDVRRVLRRRGYARTYDMSREEANGRYFEGTGVLVLDRINGTVYCAVSERADEALCRQWAQQLGYPDVVTFHSTDAQGHPVYHTNVLMAVGTDVAIVCAESVEDARERALLLGKLQESHEVVQISREQMSALCGNCLELQDDRGLPVMAMSTQAHDAFTAQQRATLLRHCASLVHAPIDTLEHIGGGGVRCALAELF